MCRLFAISGGDKPIRATFWLLDAPDNLTEQSHKNPDGTGIGWFDASGTAHVDKAPIAGFEDTAFAADARAVSARTIIAHIRYATAGAHTMQNTHPFEQDGRLFGHNGVLADLDKIQARLGDDASLIQGDTDSERLVSLITHEIRAAGGDERAGIIAAVRWLADEIELFSINFVMTTPTDVWAFRYPESNTLFVLDRKAPGDDSIDDAGLTIASGDDPITDAGPLDHRGSTGTMRVTSDPCASQSAVVVASERMDDDPRWEEVASGELVHVRPDLSIVREVIVDHPPVHMQSLTPQAKAAQQPA